MANRHDFLAKSFPRKSIDEHTQEVVASFENLLTLYPTAFSKREQALIRLACESHDLGKCNTLFQEKLRLGVFHLPDEIGHGLWSCLFLNPKDLQKQGFSRLEVSVLITSILYHHAHPFDFLTLPLKERLKDHLEAPAQAFLAPGQSLRLSNLNYRLFTLGLPSPLPLPYEDWLLYLSVKGALNKVDYHASNPQDLPIELPHPPGAASLPAAILRQIPEASLYPAQRYLLEHRGENVIIIAPAGSGKTEGSLLWLGEQKGFYTLPIKVSANAIYDRIRSPKRYGFDPVALLHSDAFSYLITETSGLGAKDVLTKHALSRALAFPLTICTVDQLFKFVFKTVGTEILAATLKYSCVIVDEIQMYDPRLMAFLCYGLRVVHDLGGHFLIMTATLPTLVTDYFKRLGVPFQFQAFLDLKSGCRHRVAIRKGDFPRHILLDQGARQRVLVLCNTIKQAQALYQDLIEAQSRLQTPPISIQLLHAQFIKKHRQRLETDILVFAPNEKTRAPATGIWISTQIVEASLDIDFDVLYTEMCTIDSLFQRMGRCYRSRPYTGTEANIFVYLNQNGRGSIYDENLYDFSCQALLPYQGKLLSEADKADIIETVFELTRLKRTEYYQTFEMALTELDQIGVGQFSKQEGDALFRDIQSLVVLPRVIFEAYQTQIEADLAQYLAPMAHQSSEQRLARQKAKDRLLSYCLSLNPSDKYKGKIPPGICPDVLDDGTLNLHLTDMVYEFDEANLTGRGLLKEFKEAELPF